MAPHGGIGPPRAGVLGPPRATAHIPFTRRRMKFQSPEWFQVFWIIPVVLLLRWYAGRKAEQAANSIVASRLKEWLVSSASPARSWSIFLLQLLAVVLFIAALAKPTFGEIKLELPEGGKNLMFIVDTSRSMLADDVVPNRLARTKLVAEDILASLDEFKVGVIAFAGRAYLQAPLTSDHEAVLETIQALDTDTIPMGGTMLSEGIREAREAFKKTKAGSHGIVLFSDGGDEDPALEKELTAAKTEHVTIMTIGVGTEVGTQIPDPEGPPGTVIMNPSTGAPVHTRLDERLLQRSAEATGGKYLTLGSKSLSGSVVKDVMRSIQSLDSGQREETKPIQRFYWPLSLGILCLMSALLLRPVGRLPRVSPATAAGFVAMVFASLGQGNAASLSGLTREEEPVRQAREAYEGQQYQRARDQYARLLAEENPPAEKPSLAYGLAAAAHQLQDYDRALENYSLALESADTTLQQSAHSGLGTTLYEQGAKAFTQQPEFTERVWTDSLRHYDAALNIKADNRTAVNRRHVEEQLKQLKQQLDAKRQQEKQKQQKGDKSKDQQGQEGEENEEESGQQGDWKDGLKKLQEDVKDFMQKNQPGGKPQPQDMEKLQQQMQEFLKNTQPQQPQESPPSGEAGEKEKVKEEVEKLKKPTDEFAEKGDQPQGREPGDQAGAKGEAGELGEQMEKLLEQLNKKGEQGKEGEEGKDGQKGEKGEKGEQGKEGEKGTGDKGEQGEAGEGQQNQPEGLNQSEEGQPLPEGQIQAQLDQGKISPEEAKQMQEMIENKIMETTGFSRNQAREMLRAYNDQMATQFRRQREQTLKDW